MVFMGLTAVQGGEELPTNWPSSTVGAGDTFIAGMLYGLFQDWDVGAKLKFAVSLASLKVQQEGFGGLGGAILNADRAPVTQRQSPE
jgi:fructose-1-phosphate kinase PfkB-like protein